MQPYISIAALGFFYMSNRHILSTIFGHDLRRRPWRSAEIISSKSCSAISGRDPRQLL